MNIFKKAFGEERLPNTKKRTFANLLGGINANYLQDYLVAQNDYNNGNFNSSLNNINKVIEKSDVNDWKHFAFRANVLEDLKQYDKAISDYKTAIGFAIDDIEVYALYHQIGFCYLSLGKNEKAEEFYSYAIELKKQHSNSDLNPDQEGMDKGVMLGLPYKRMYNNRANALKNIGKLNEAFEDCKTALNYDKNYSNSYLLLSQIFSQAGQESKALEMLNAAANLGNQNAINMLNQIK